jgi:hypothetical protein
MTLRLIDETPKLGFAPYSPKPRQSRRQAFRFRSLFGMVRARFFHGLWLSPFHKGGIGQTTRKRITLLGCGFDGFANPAAFGVEINNAIQGENDGIITHYDLRDIIGIHRRIDKCVNAPKP